MFDKECRSRYGMLAIVSILISITCYAIMLFGVITESKKWIGMVQLLLLSGKNSTPIESQVEFEDESDVFAAYLENVDVFDATEVYDDEPVSQPEQPVVNTSLETMLAFYANEVEYSYCDITDMSYAEDAFENDYSDDPIGYKVLLYTDYFGTLPDDPAREFILERQPAVIEIIEYEDHTDYVMDLTPEYGLRLKKGDKNLLEGAYPAYPGYYVAQESLYVPEEDANWSVASPVGAFSNTIPENRVIKNGELDDAVLHQLVGEVYSDYNVDDAALDELTVWYEENDWDTFELSADGSLLHATFYDTNKEFLWTSVLGAS